VLSLVMLSLHCCWSDNGDGRTMFLAKGLRAKALRAILELRWNTASRAGSARHDLLVQFLIYDLDRAVDLGIGHAQLM
jgi:hypothetical protein